MTEEEAWAREAEAERRYFGSDTPNTYTSKCNVCGVQLGAWGDDKKKHISFHESLLTPPTHNEGVWTMTDSELQRELAKAWHRGQKAAIIWQHHCDNGKSPAEPKCPYEDSNPAHMGQGGY